MCFGAFLAHLRVTE